MSREPLLLATLAVAMLLSTPAARSGELSFAEITAWYGEGPNETALVIDWNDDREPQSLVWGYRFADGATTHDMLLTIAAADPRLAAFEHQFSFGSIIFGLGYDLDGDGGDFLPGEPGAETGFATDEDDHYEEGWLTGFWSFWICDDCAAEPDATEWLSAPVGTADRVLIDGGWDGLSFDPALTFEDVPSPATPVDPVADLNCDGAVNGFDIDPFVLALTDPAGYVALYPECAYRNADVNADGTVDGFDIDAFVALLTGRQGDAAVSFR